MHASPALPASVTNRMACPVHDIHGGAHGLTVEKVCMLVWLGGLGPHVCLDSNPFKCARDLAWCLGLVTMPRLLQGGALHAPS